MVVTINYILDKIVHGRTYDRNGCVEATYEMFCKESHINQFLHQWHFKYCLNELFILLYVDNFNTYISNFTYQIFFCP